MKIQFFCRLLHFKNMLTHIKKVKHNRKILILLLNVKR